MDFSTLQYSTRSVKLPNFNYILFKLSNMLRLPSNTAHKRQTSANSSSMKAPDI